MPLHAGGHEHVARAELNLAGGDVEDCIDEPQKRFTSCGHRCGSPARG